MAAIDEYDGWPTVRAALQFLALTMTRPGDVRFMRRPEMNFTKSMWSIPAERMKMRRPHEVPLPTQALDVLKTVWELSEDDGYVFPSIRSHTRPLSEVALNAALRRLGYRAPDGTGCSRDPADPHRTLRVLTLYAAADLLIR